MIVLLDTSAYDVRLTLVDSGDMMEVVWQADRELAKGLLAWLSGQLEAKGKKLSDVSGLGAYRGPGSFTGLRIGITVMNTLAESLGVAIVGTMGEEWKLDAVSRLQSGEDDKLIMPFYDRDATITKQRK